jgi:hypothetical protein
MVLQKKIGTFVLRLNSLSLYCLETDSIHLHNYTETQKINHGYFAMLFFAGSETMAIGFQIAASFSAAINNDIKGNQIKMLTV